MGRAKPRPTPSVFRPLPAPRAERVFSPIRSAKIPRLLGSAVSELPETKPRLRNRLMPRAHPPALLPDSREENFGGCNLRVFKARRPLDIALVPVRPRLPEKRKDFFGYGGITLRKFEVFRFLQVYGKNPSVSAGKRPGLLFEVQVLPCFDSAEPLFFRIHYITRHEFLLCEDCT